MSGLENLDFFTDKSLVDDPYGYASATELADDLGKTLDPREGA